MNAAAFIYMYIYIYIHTYIERERDVTHIGEHVWHSGHSITKACCYYSLCNSYQIGIRMLIRHSAKLVRCFKSQYVGALT